MKKIMVLVAIAGAIFAGCVSGPRVDNTPVAALDLNRYLGEWYEIARFDHSFERGIEQAKAVYTLNEDGTFLQAFSRSGTGIWYNASSHECRA